MVTLERRLACFASGLLLLLALAALPPAVRAAEPPTATAAETPFPPEPSSKRPAEVEDYISLSFQLRPLREAALSLTGAALLASVLAFRPRRRGTPERSASVAQTQIILAVVGSVVMIIVGVSVARAFGIMGAASLVRYRAKVNDPKDAGVMLATLGIGLATGVGLYFFAAFATLFILALLWMLESREPEDVKRFILKITSKEKGALDLRTPAEELLRRNRLTYELRTTSPEELSYEVRIPARKRTDRLSSLILALGKPGGLEVEWDEKKDKK
jgi:uncharacterized membrane protein YhiD involved in acid resistance